MNRVTVLLIYVASFFVAAMVGVQGWNFVLMMWDPFYFHAVHEITHVLKPGEFFIEEIDVTRYRICRVDVDQFMSSDETHEVFYRERVPAGATPIGRTTLRNMIRLPANTPLGGVTLLQAAHSQCIDGVHSVALPPMHFRVVP